MYLFITEWKKIWKKNLGVSFLIITVIVSAVFFILNYQQKNPSQALYESHVLTTSQHENQAHNWRPTYFIETGEYEEIDEEMINDNLYTAGLEDPNLVIRTSGEERLSGFLLWQSSYFGCRGQ